VFVIDDNRVWARKVEVGIRGSRKVEIVSGLNDGERVAAPALEDLRDGRRVRLVERRPEIP
jgi:multidrug efflux pump subunit AcrA (membrane-fusion protein)